MNALPPVGPERTLWLLQQSQALEGQSPRDILAWAFANLPGMVMTTAFQPGGIVLLDLVHALGFQPPAIFVDTLWHFPETLALAEQCRTRFGMDLRVYTPQEVTSEAEFVAKYGPELWETDLDLFQEVTKVEPMRRAMRETAAQAWISGRRRDQGGERSELAILEAAGERIKVNPLAAWTRKEVWGHITSRNLPYNPLHDQGYPSIGDRPLTEKADADQGERAGRWKGRGKTECGIHTAM